VQYGKQANGTQRYRCNNLACPRTIFLLQYHDKGRLPAVKQQIVDMTLNGSGVREASITGSATFGHSASPDNVTYWHIMALQ
jgi:transposase-like protein